jgi:DNA-binding response OmpR family regulator
MDKFKVLIADSTASVRQFIRYTLEDHFPNIEFEVATNGKNIQKRLESTHFDLILYDREMPMLNGEELLKWLRNHDTLKNIPFIMISSDRDEESLKRAVQLGADAYLIKPLLMDSLVSKVREIFSKFDKTKFDRRKYERYRIQGNVLLEFDSRSCRGTLLNISMGGLLGAFNKNDTLPQILNKVSVSLEVENRRKIEGVWGHIVRIQVVDSFIDPEQIQFAVKFTETLSVEKKKELSEFISSLRYFK